MFHIVVMDHFFLIFLFLGYFCAYWQLKEVPEVSKSCTCSPATYGCLSRRRRPTCNTSQHVMCIEEEPGDQTVEVRGVLTQLPDHYLEEEEEQYNVSSNRLLMRLFLLKLSETDSVGGGISQKTPVLAE